MEFACSVCQYTSDHKRHVVRHINKKKSCGSGVREVIEIPIDVKCEFCGKAFATRETMKEHIRKTCKHKDDAKDEEIRKLKEELRKAKSVTNIDNSTNTTNYIIVINNYEDTSLDKLTDKTYNKIIKDVEEPYKMIPKLIKAVHFNPNIPENHNIYLSNRNKNNKHLQIYRNGHWEITDKNTEIDNLINDKETILGDWVAEKGEDYSETVEKFNEYLEQKYDDDIAKLVKEEVELLLYNGRHMIKSN
jgi:transcriptional regulator NrdR family protein